MTTITEQKSLDEFKGKREMVWFGGGGVVSARVASGHSCRLADKGQIIALEGGLCVWGDLHMKVGAWVFVCK
jgi:hypothetical protein